MSDAQHLECVERATAEPITASVVWLHGLGADGHDFEPLVDELRRTAPIGVRFVFPHAPAQPVTVNGGMTLPAWYDILGLGEQIQEDEAGLETARGHVEALLRRERERGVPAERIVLAGFSQGAATALYTAAQAQPAPAGVIALSGWLPPATPLEAAAARPPMRLAHGTQDPIVPLELGRDARQRLEQAGFPVAWHEFPMEHAVCLPEIQQVDEWLSGLLGAG